MTPRAPAQVICVDHSGEGMHATCIDAGCAFDLPTTVCSKKPAHDICADHSGAGRYTSCTTAGCIFDVPTKVCSRVQCPDLSGTGNFNTCTTAPMGCMFDTKTEACTAIPATTAIPPAAMSALQAYGEPQMHRTGLWQDGEGQIGQQLQLTNGAAEHCAMQCTVKPECHAFSVKPAKQGSGTELFVLCRGSF